LCASVISFLIIVFVLLGYGVATYFDDIKKYNPKKKKENVKGSKTLKNPIVVDHSIQMMGLGILLNLM